MTSYKQLPYRLPTDIRVYRDTRRCMRPMYDKKDGRTTYTVAPMESIKEPLTIEALPERWVSPLCKNKREPYLLEYYYNIKEKELNDIYNTVGIRIQIYSIINALNVHTRFMLELVCNQPKKWKRVMVTSHLSEICKMLPHVVDEMWLDDDDTKCNNIESKVNNTCWLY